MDAEKKILEGYYQKNSTGFEFADSEQFGDVATYFGVSGVYIDRLEQQLSQLQQEKEDLIKWLENEDEKLWATANDGHRFIKNVSLIERRGTLREILSKLKEGDKGVC